VTLTFTLSVAYIKH